jgi:hypothetical protein
LLANFGPRHVPESVRSCSVSISVCCISSSAIFRTKPDRSNSRAPSKMLAPKTSGSIFFNNVQSRYFELFHLGSLSNYSRRGSWNCGKLMRCALDVCDPLFVLLLSSVEARRLKPTRKLQFVNVPFQLSSIEISPDRIWNPWTGAGSHWTI